MEPLEEELELAKNLALEAGKAILGFYENSSVTIKHKSLKEPVTEADFLSDKIIREGLNKKYPKDWVCSEETKDHRDRLLHSRVWCVDPLDGTKEFIAKLGEFAVQIALIIENKVEMGVVYLPVFDKLYYGGKKIGANLSSKNGTVALKIKDKQAGLIIGGSRSHRSQEYEQIISLLHPEKEILVGSMGVKAGLLAEEKINLFFYRGNTTKEWDIAAPLAIVEGAGGMVTDFSGNSLHFNKKKLNNPNGILASNKTCHKKVIPVIKSLKKE